MKFFAAALIAAFAALAAATPPVHAHEGHDHGAPPPPLLSQPLPRAVAATGDFDVVAILVGKQLQLHVDRPDGSPVAGATLAVDGAGTIVGVRETAPGIYAAELATAPAPGRHALTIVIETAESADLLSATLDVPESAAATDGATGWRRWFGRPAGVPPARAAGDAPPQRLADGSLFVPRPVQRQLALRTIVVRAGDLAATFELNGTVIADPGTSGRVQAPFAGSVLPGPKGMPVGGRRVVKGEVLAWLHPVAGAIERGNQQSQLAEIEAQLAIADGRVKRLEQLEGAVPQKEIETARIERAALGKRRSFVSASIERAEPLRAPAGGVISASHHLVAGQIVDAREVLFEIVDPARLAVEALAYDTALATSIAGASARADDGTALDLNFVGGGRQLRGQALPLLFRVATRDAAVAVGQPLQVMVRTAQGIRGMAVPREALTKAGAGQGYDGAVWVRVDAERFAARPVRVRPLDAGRVAIVEGLQDGDRVVSAGASLLAQVK